jgi:hypothetical protein
MVPDFSRREYTIGIAMDEREVCFSLKENDPKPLTIAGCTKWEFRTWLQS